jgi:hypothetical protein
MGFLGAATSAISCIARTNHCERVLRIEVVVHNTQELQCVRSLEKFPQIALQAKVILERFMDALSCIDQCFISDSMLEQLLPPSWVGKTKVGGIDLNKPRMRSNAPTAKLFTIWGRSRSKAENGLSSPDR